MSHQTKKGDKVKIHYTGKLDNGKVFDTTQDRDPLEITIGSGKFIPGFEKGIIGMESGDTKTITIPPEKACGERFEDLVVNIKKSDLSEGIKPTIGQKLKAHQPDGKIIDIVVTDMTDDTVTLDANHPLAGKTLTFDIELVEIVK